MFDIESGAGHGLILELADEYRWFTSLCLLREKSKTQVAYSQWSTVSRSK